MHLGSIAEKWGRGAALPSLREISKTGKFSANQVGHKFCDVLGMFMSGDRLAHLVFPRPCKILLDSGKLFSLADFSLQHNVCVAI